MYWIIRGEGNGVCIKNLMKLIIVLALVIVSTSFLFTYAYEPTEASNETVNNNFKVCIDPGHQAKYDSRGEPVAPGSSTKKARVSAGTKGVATKKNEYEVNLEAALLLREMLNNKSYNVIMTRDNNNVNISNIERAEIANENNSDIAIRIHCDSLLDSSKTGATILVPNKECEWTKEIYENSYTFATILQEKLKEGNIKVNGVFERKDITGFNWSKVPVIILEMGFMSNYNEDTMLSNPNYQKKIMNCVSEAIDEYQNVMIKR